MEYDLLNRFIPILYLHPKEETSPISIENYIENSELCIGGKRKKIQKYPWNKPIVIRKNKNILIEKGKVTLPLPTRYKIMPDKYLDYQGKYSIPNRITMDIIPIYGLIEYYENYIDIIYIFNYYYNNAYKIFGIYIGGEHQADIEHIRIRITKNKQMDKKIESFPYNVSKIYFSAHTTDQGRWVKSKNIEWHNNIPNGRPIIYVAKGSHANYPSPGTWYRIFGFANDKTKKKDAIKWKPYEVINLNDREDIMSYDGDMGNNGVDDLNRNWKIPPSEKIHPGFFYRFFYPVSKSLCKILPTGCCSSRK